VYRHTGCGTCQDSRYNIVKYKYYTVHITKDTYYVRRYDIDTYYVSRCNIVKHKYYTLHIDIDTYYVNRYVKNLIPKQKTPFCNTVKFAMGKCKSEMYLVLMLCTSELDLNNYVFLTTNSNKENI